MLFVLPFFWGGGHFQFVFLFSWLLERGTIFSGIFCWGGGVWVLCPAPSVVAPPSVSSCGEGLLTMPSHCQNEVLVSPLAPLRPGAPECCGAGLGTELLLCLCGQLTAGGSVCLLTAPLLVWADTQPGCPSGLPAIILVASWVLCCLKAEREVQVFPLGFVGVGA